MIFAYIIVMNLDLSFLKGSMIDRRVSFNAPYEKILENIQIGFFDILHTGLSIIDTHGNFSYCNRAFIQMHGLPEDVIGRNVREFFPIKQENLPNGLLENKIAISLDESERKICGILFNYCLYDNQHEFCGVMIESIPCNIPRDKLGGLMENMHSLEMQSFSPSVHEKRKPRDLNTFAGMIGESKAMRSMRLLGERFALSNEPVLVNGESGTGKELVAKALHAASRRAKAPFISVNCAALPAELIESELFGYEAGSFTGARASGMKGKFEQANGGTIFLDEIGELPLQAQAKLLRVLENGEIQKIGCRVAIHSNFRLIGATNRDLLQMVRLGKFREDLYHRLSVFELNVPPLREREDDVFLLARFYLDQYLDCDESVWIDEEMEKIFRNYSWPGNIRELKNTLVYALYALGSGQNTVCVRHLPQRFLKSLRGGAELTHKPETSEEPVQQPMTEEQMLRFTLERLRYNKALAARELGISRSKLYRKLHKYGFS